VDHQSQDLRIDLILEPLHVQALASELAVKDSFIPSAWGLRGSMKAVAMLTSVSGSGLPSRRIPRPLSLLRYRGAPWALSSLDNTSLTLPERVLPATSLARHPPQTLHVYRLQFAKALTPGVNRRVADPVPLGNLGHRASSPSRRIFAICSSKKAGRLHGSSFVEGHFSEVSAGTQIA
jgi:hypothetical protein